uniref:Uncharacterized protein n=1 Tax=Tetraselmis chuii TaxID=63592 RepID=A0A7S1SZQ3_9CHLO
MGAPGSPKRSGVALVQLHGRAAAVAESLMAKMAHVLTVRGSARQLTMVRSRYWAHLRRSAASRLEVASLELEEMLRRQAAIQRELDRMLAQVSALTGVEVVMLALPFPDEGDASSPLKEEGDDDGAPSLHPEHTTSTGQVLLESQPSIDGAYELVELRSRLHGGEATTGSGGAEAVTLEPHVHKMLVAAAEAAVVPPARGAWDETDDNEPKQKRKEENEEVEYDEAVEADVVEMVVGAVVDGMVEALESTATEAPVFPAPLAHSHSVPLSWSPIPLMPNALNQLPPLHLTSPPPLQLQQPTWTGASPNYGYGVPSPSAMLSHPMPGQLPVMGQQMSPHHWPFNGVPGLPTPPPWATVMGPASTASYNNYNNPSPLAPTFGMPGVYHQHAYPHLQQQQQQPTLVVPAAGLPGQPPLTEASVPGQPMGAVPVASGVSEAPALHSMLPAPDAEGSRVNSRPVSPALSLNPSAEWSSSMSIGGSRVPRPQRKRHNNQCDTWNGAVSAVEQP